MSTISVSARRIAPALLGCGLLLAGASAMAASLTEGFDAGVPANWTLTNNTSQVGVEGWDQGNPGVFGAQAGAADSYVAASFNSAANAADISNWLITPTLTFNNGDIVSFYTSTVATPSFADRLEVRFSSVGGVNVGSTSTSVGTFTTLLLTVNPNLTLTGYPSTWTKYTATISGLSGATSGAVAFRYFVPDGGPMGSNSDYIGIDSFAIAAAVPEPSSVLMLALGLAGIGVRRLRASARS